MVIYKGILKTFPLKDETSDICCSIICPPTKSSEISVTAEISGDQNFFEVETWLGVLDSVLKIFFSDRIIFILVVFWHIQLVKAKYMWIRENRPNYPLFCRRRKNLWFFLWKTCFCSIGKLARWLTVLPLLFFRKNSQKRGIVTSIRLSFCAVMSLVIFLWSECSQFERMT